MTDRQPEDEPTAQRADPTDQEGKPWVLTAVVVTLLVALTVMFLIWALVA